MKIIVSFEKTEEGFKSPEGIASSLAGKFLSSLRLDPEMWMHAQECELDPRMGARVFGIDNSPIPLGLLDCSKWVCRFEGREGFTLLQVNGIPWGIRLGKNFDFNGIEDAGIPAEILILSLGLNTAEKIEFLGRFESLSGLSLQKNRALNDLSPLASLRRLSMLDLRDCESISDLSPLRGLTNLKRLDLGTCRGIADLGPLKGLEKLESLNLGSCTGVSELFPLSGLASLQSLTLSGIESLSDLVPLRDLRSLRYLNLSMCSSLKDISPLSGLTNLIRLDLFKCKALIDLRPLSGLESMLRLDLQYCSSLVDLTPLKGMKALRMLDLNWVESLSDLTPLSGLTSLESLNLFGCKSLKDLSPVSSLSSLKSLGLGGSDLISDLSPLGSLLFLKKLVFTSRRIRSIEPLREIPELREVKEFDPPQVAECLAHASVLRFDRTYIADHAEEWLKEASGWEAGSLHVRDRFASTLGEAFSLLGEHPIEHTYEEFLCSHPEFTSSPWRAWLEGTRKENGDDLMHRRVERQKIISATPGCLGGICCVLPEGEAWEAWALKWLADLEKERSANAKELLPVAPEICLAYARFGEMEALGRWLERLTDPSDPGALDPLHAQFAEWQLGQGNTLEALNHISAINSPSVSDPLYASLASYWLKDQPIKSGEVLLMIESQQIRRETGIKLAANDNFAKSPENIHRLVAAVGDSPSNLAGIIKALGDRADSALIKELSSSLELPDDAFKARSIARLETMLKEAKTL